MVKISIPDRKVNRDHSDDREQLQGQRNPPGSKALEFLRALRPSGPWVLTAIIPDGATTTRTFERNEAEEARQFIVEHNGAGKNLYYTVNVTRTALRTKAKKSDIGSVEYLFIDVDPEPDEAPSGRKRWVRSRLESYQPAPTFVVDSDNGMQLLWKLREPVTIPAENNAEVIKDIEDRNHALAELFMADVTVRNIDRILRLPGTENFPNEVKRQHGRGQCRAKWLERTERSYKLERFAPREAPVPTSSAPSGAPGTVTELPPNVSEKLHLTTSAGYATRSELLFSFMLAALHVRGVTDETIIKACLDPQFAHCVIYKHCQEQGGRKYVARQLRRARIKFLREDSEARTLVHRPFSKFKSRKLKWLWEPFIPLGMLTTVFGDGETGKSSILLDIAARITNGAPWPQIGGEEPQLAPLGKVVILCKEDDVGIIIRPRLEAAGADLSRVEFLGYEVPDDPDDLDPLERLDTTIEEFAENIDDIGGVKLVMVDPISEYGGDINTSRDSEVRSVLTPLSRLAARKRVAIVNILHLNKQSDQAVKYRGLGSVAYRNASKSTVLVTKDPDDPDHRIMAQEKKNLTKHQRAVGFRFCTVPRNPFPRIEWDRDWLEFDVNELLSRKPNKQKVAERKLQEWLKDGPQWAKKIREKADQAGIGESTLKQAKTNLGVVSKKRDGRWFWRLPREGMAD